MELPVEECWILPDVLRHCYWYTLFMYTANRFMVMYSLKYVHYSVNQTLYIKLCGSETYRFIVLQAEI